MKTAYKILILLIISTVSIGLDQWTKLWATQSLKGKFPRYYFDGIFQLVYAENTGAWGNLGGNWPEPLRLSFLIILPLAVLVFIVFYITLSDKIKNIEVYGLSFIVSGGIGNLIDRIKLDHVVDFMYIGYKKIGTNIFNIADAVIMLGFFMLVFQAFLEKLNKKNSPS